jgi:hypothetical protein
MFGSLAPPKMGVRSSSLPFRQPEIKSATVARWVVLLLMRDPGNLHPPPGLRPRRRSHGALEVWSVRVLRQVGTEPDVRGAGAGSTDGPSAGRDRVLVPRPRERFRSRSCLSIDRSECVWQPSTPSRRAGTRALPIRGSSTALLTRMHDRGVGDAARAEDLSVLKFVRHPNFPNPNPGKHVNSSILEPNASTFSELLVHSAPFSTL